MVSRHRLTLAALSTFALCTVAFAGGCADEMAGPSNDAATDTTEQPELAGGPGGMSTYRVTIENLTPGQPFSPPVAATHRKNMIRMFQKHRQASLGLEKIAEDGNDGPMANRFRGSDHVTDVVQVGAPLTPHGTVVGSFTDTVSFDIEARRGDRFSLATMLICSNDGFTGLDSAELPLRAGHSKVYWLEAYDAGTEDNTEMSTDIVDACSALGPTALSGGPNGNENDAVDSSPHYRIERHRGIQGHGDLDASDHGWHGAVAKVTIERM